MAVNVGTIVATLRLQSQQFITGMKQAAKTAEKAGERLGDVSKRATGVGKSLSVGVTLPLVGASLAAIKFSQDMNAGMANVASLIPGSTERVKELKTTVQDLAVATGISTTDMADGLYNVISALGDTADTEKILEINARAAAAGLSTVTDAINLTSGVTKGYGDISAVATQKASDLAFTTVKLGQTTFPELAGALGRVVPIASKLNLSQEELFATFATLTGVTGKTSQVSTQFAAVLTGLMKPTSGMTDAVAELGFAGSESMLQTLGFKDTLDALIATTDGSAEAVGKLFGSQEALVGIFALTGEQAGVYDEKLKALGVSTGATDEAFKEQTQGINAAGFAWKQLKIELTTVAQQIGDELQPVFTDIVSTLKDDLVPVVKEWITWFKALSPETKENYVQLAALVTVLPVMILMLGQIGSAVSGVIAMAGAIKAMTAGTWLATAATRAWSIAILNIPLIGWALAAAAAIAALTVVLYKNWDAITGWVKGLFGAGKAVEEVNAAMEQTLPAAEDMRDALGEAGVTGTVEELHTAMANLGGVVGGLNEEEMATIAKRAIQLRIEGEELTPELERVADHMIKMADGAAEAAKQEERLTRETNELSKATLEYNERIADQVKEWREDAIPAGREAMAVLEAFGGSLDLLSKDKLQAFNTAVGEMNEHLVRTNQEIPQDAMDAWIKSFDLLNPRVADLSDHLESIPIVPPDFLAIPQQPLEQALEKFGLLNTTVLEGKSVFGKWGDSVKGGFKDLWKGMTGGTSKISGLFSKLGSGIMDGFGEIISGGLSSLINMGVEFAMKGLMKLGSWIKGKFGVSAAEKEARALNRAFEATVIASLSATQKIEAGGQKWKQIVIGVRDAYIKAGRSAEEAERMVARLWAAEKRGPEAVQAIIDSIQTVIDLAEEIDKLTQDTIDGLINLAAEGARTGSLLPDQLQPFLDTLVELGELTEADMLLLMAMAEQAQYDWKEVQAAAERYGVEVDLLGERFREAQLAEQAAQVASDWELMSVKGAKANRIARRMAKTVQSLIDDYAAAGIAIPESMRPVIERQIELGLLTNANGEAITDIGELDFAPALVTQFDRLIEAIQALIDRLVGEDGVTEAIETVNDTELHDRHVNVDVRYDDPGFTPHGDGSYDPMSQRHGTGGKFIDFGQGTPAVLHGRERVMTEAEGVREGMISGPGGQDTSEALLRQVSGLRREIQNLPLHLRDAILLAQ